MEIDMVVANTAMIEVTAGYWYFIVISYLSQIFRTHN